MSVVTLMGIGSKKNKNKASRYYQMSAPILPNLFQCYQNERKVEKDKPKTFIGCQNIKKVNHDVGVHDLDRWQMNNGKNERPVRIIDSTDDNRLRAVNINDRVAAVKYNNKDCTLQQCMTRKK
ncbi:6352_t:CDS:1 [Gigaspora margarita]|uniref:6352_t:CDS:1 n=1 Tax=Gigaspora margarita TaxID=4874 RepID=A0ABN7UKF5_GIGMA|nr:6352_t:CDS:1 [Gigaspora margarita]